jgi:hypothetical protein
MYAKWIRVNQAMSQLRWRETMAETGESKYPSHRDELDEENACLQSTRPEGLVRDTIGLEGGGCARP